MGKTLLILAAGMGSRYGGLKQFDRLGPSGETIMDYSVFDAIRAGFDRVVFDIRRDFEAEFKEVVGERYSKYIKVDYAFQSLDDLPAGFQLPAGREKPWGTAHAVYAARELLTEPFGVINADDFYGADSYRQMAAYFDRAAAVRKDKVQGCIVSFVLERTMSENGSVSRGVCSVENGLLTGVVERTKIVPREGGAAFLEEDGETFLPAGTLVSMNLWAFQHSMLDELKARFAAYLDENVPVNPMKCEYFLPLVPNALIRENAGSVRVLETSERWFGVTYHDDLEKVQAAIRAKKAAGEYPEELWAN